MNILLVTHRYHPFLGGVETQLRLVAHQLAERHHVEVVALCLNNNHAQGAGGSSAARRFLSRLTARARRGFSKTSTLARLWRILEDTLLLPAYRGYRDGKVPVHTLSPTLFQRIRLLGKALRGFRDPIWTEKQHVRHARNGRLWHTFYRSLYVPRLRALVRGKEVVHCTTDDALGWAVEEAARAEGVPFVMTPYVHPGHDGDDPDNVALYQRAEILFALIETGRDVLIGLGAPAERIRLTGVVPLLPDAPNPEGFRARHGLGVDPIVLFVGRMANYKGFPALLDSARHVWSKIPSAQFVFVGPGDEEAQDRFAKYPDKRIHYLGLVSEAEKGDAMAACDIFCMPSVAEILPAVYLEAWSCGKAVIGGTAAGLAELIEGNGAGIIVRQDETAISDALCRLLLDASLRHEMGEKGRALVRARFSTEALVSSLEKAYEAVRRPVGAEVPKLSAPPKPYKSGGGETPENVTDQHPAE